MIEPAVGTEAPTWRALVADAVARGVDPIEARWLGEEATGAEPHEWVHVLDRPCTALTHRRFVELVERRVAGEPVQYVVGHWPFRRLDLLVDRRVLIPRPETEWVVEVAVELLPPTGTPAIAADLGTGSGAIALAIASERHPDVRVVATDSSVSALAVAGANLAGLGWVGTTVELRHGDWYDALPAELEGCVDLVVSNPPYVAPTDPLPPEVADWEPRDALVPGPTGLEALEVIVADAPRWLSSGGWLVCEIGETQGEAVARLALEAGLAEVEIRRDLTGRDRALIAKNPFFGA